MAKLRIPPKGDATYRDYPELVWYPGTNTIWEIPNVVTPSKREFFCPKCDVLWTIRPARLQGCWHYRGKCPDCSTTWSNLYKIKTKCPECGKENFVQRQNYLGKCDCAGPIVQEEREFPEQDEFGADI